MEPLKVFYSYAHEDRDLCEELKKYLIPLKRAGVISDWYDRDIPAGKEWEKEIDHHLGDADLILLLVSADFMASDYCWGVEVARAMERHDKGEARVVPVILRPSVWQDAPFHKLQCLPAEARPVTAWQDRDEALVDVAGGIRGAAEELRQIEAQRLAEEKRAAEEKRRAEAQRQAEEQRVEEVRRQEEQRRIAEQRRLEEKRRAEEQRRLEEKRQIEERQRTEATSPEPPRQPSPRGANAIAKPFGGGSRRLVGGLVIVILVGVGVYFISIMPRESNSVVMPPVSENSQEPKTPPVKEATAVPAAQKIHGWSADKVQDLQKRTEQGVGKSVEFRDLLKDGGQGPEMVVIPAGEFLMGSPGTEEGREDDERQHQVVIEKPFAMGKYAVSFDEYDHFAKATSRKLPDDENWGRGSRPVINVSWFDAVAYAEWLSEQTGEEYRLPTEAEWEYAARAGTATPFWFGETISTAQANYGGSQSTVPVDAFEPNPWGLYNVHGNVWEWTCSGYEKSYNGAENRCISNNNASDPRVLRGGSWYFKPRRLRSAQRYGGNPGWRLNSGGFRLARSFSL